MANISYRLSALSYPYYAFAVRIYSFIVFCNKKNGNKRITNCRNLLLTFSLAKIFAPLLDTDNPRMHG